jgi:hypothetical protein
MNERASPSSGTSGKKSPTERKAILDQAFAGTSLTGGRRVAGRVAGQSEYEVVLVRGRRSSHRLHLCLTILTVGLWGPVWLGMWLAERDKREIASVDEHGNTAVARA